MRYKETLDFIKEERILLKREYEGMIKAMDEEDIETSGYNVQICNEMMIDLKDIFTRGYTEINAMLDKYESVLEEKIKDE